MSVALTHDGLPSQVTKFDLSHKLAAVASSLKLTCRELKYLDRAIRVCEDIDFLPDAICACWVRVSKMAHWLNCTPRTINSIEKSLERKGLIVRTTGNNGNRHGVRGKDGKVSMAVGSNLAPLIEKYQEFVELNTASELRDRALRVVRADIQIYRRKIRAVGKADAVETAERVIPRGRVSDIDDPEKLEAILEALIAVYQAIATESGRIETSDEVAEIADASEVSDAPDIQIQDSKRICRAAPARLASPVTARQAMLLASPRFRAAVEALGSPTMSNLVDAARVVGFTYLGIGQQLWGEACSEFERERAALCVLAIDRNLHLPIGDKRRPNSPGGALIGMLRRERASGFNLHGMLKAIQGYHSEPVEDDDTSAAEPVLPPMSEARSVGGLTAQMLQQVQQRMEANREGQ